MLKVNASFQAAMFMSRSVWKVRWQRAGICQTPENPTPSRDSNPLTDLVSILRRKRRLQSFLIVRRALPGDSGSYQCRAKNRAGEDAKRARVSVGRRRVPPPPRPQPTGPDKPRPREYGGLRGVVEYCGLRGIGRRWASRDGGVRWASRDGGVLWTSRVQKVWGRC